MSELPILDVFILAMLDRGCESLYDLQHDAGLSLGASIPALKRLKKAKMVTQGEDRSKGKRVRFEFKLTAAGRREAKQSWQPWLDREPPADIDSVLRLLDLGFFYGLPVKKLVDFALRAARMRLEKAAQAEALPEGETYKSLRLECEARRLKSEAAALEAIGGRLAYRSKPARKKDRSQAGQPTWLDAMGIK